MADIQDNPPGWEKIADLIVALGESRSQDRAELVAIVNRHLAGRDETSNPVDFLGASLVEIASFLNRLQTDGVVVDFSRLKAETEISRGMRELDEGNPFGLPDLRPEE